MTINKRFGKLDNNNIFSYAPMNIKVNSGSITNPPDEIYLSKGWYIVIDVRPDAEPGCFVKFERYIKDDVNKTITFEYSQQIEPIVRQIFVYSKLKLESILFKMNKLELFDRFLDETMIYNDAGFGVAIRRFYDQAQELKSDNELFESYVKVVQEKLGLTNEKLDKILKEISIF